ncbi:hypothetical protein P879_08526 [Paragonimus westermani]|uniref:PHD-type domain-containing protein n=1 Tax=Paragonimus westermani TaxID=34504 RepID=A0A8T0D939_9TREM|nr:hypothetical protein P879_08526 [Paragonimus westermani]
MTSVVLRSKSCGTWFLNLRRYELEYIGNRTPNEHLQLQTMKPNKSSVRVPFITSFLPNFSPALSTNCASNRSSYDSARGLPVRSYNRNSGLEYCPSGTLNESNDKNTVDIQSTPSLMSGSIGSTISSIATNEIVELTHGANAQRLHSLHPVVPTVNNTSSGNNNGGSGNPTGAPTRSQPYSTSSSSLPLTPNTPYSAPLLNWIASDAYMPPSSEHPPAYTHNVYRLSPGQRRFERQRCADRTGTAPVVSCVPTCVYCLGDDRLNPRVNRPEGLLRCSRCGTWAHFSCLHLPTHVIDTAMRYAWQCIECKTCWLCGSPEHEMRMVFCGDCDRAFHVDCLPTPIPRASNTHWSCDICLHELYAMTDGPERSSTEKMSSSCNQHETARYSTQSKGI